MAEATLSSKNQIVVPREAREALGVRAGDKLLIVVRGNTVVILPRPRSWTKALRGLAGQAYPHKAASTGSGTIGTRSPHGSHVVAHDDRVARSAVSRGE